MRMGTHPGLEVTELLHQLLPLRLRHIRRQVQRGEAAGG